MFQQPSGFSFGHQPTGFGQGPPQQSAPSGFFVNPQQSTAFGDGQLNAFAHTAPAAAPATSSGFPFGVATGFGTAQPQAQTGFGSTQPQSVFGGTSQPQAQTGFGSTQPSNFGGQPAAAASFGSLAQQPAPAFQQSASPFGSGANFGGSGISLDDDDVMMIDSTSGPSASSPFGNLGQNAPAASTTFGGGTPFGQAGMSTAASSTSFGQPAANTASSPFDQAASGGFGSTNDTGFAKSTTVFGRKNAGFGTPTSGKGSPLASNAASSGARGGNTSPFPASQSGRPPHPPVNQRSRSRLVGIDDDAQRDAMQALSGMAPSFIGTSDAGRDGRSTAAASTTAAGNDDDPDLSDDEEDVKVRGWMSTKFKPAAAAAGGAADDSLSLSIPQGDNEGPINLEDAVILQGKNMNMCSDAEIRNRVERNQIKLPERLHELLKNPDGSERTHIDTCVKEGVRCAAGTIKNDENQVRPPEWLRITMKYLVDHIMDLRYGPGSPNNDPRIQEHVAANPQWDAERAVAEVARSIFDFVWDRTRELRGDYGMQGFQLTVGRLDSVEDIHVFEQILRWHLVMYDRVYNVDPSQQHGNWVQNRVQLVACLASLQELFTVARNKVKRGQSDVLLSPHEAECCAYYLILNFENKEEVSKALRQWLVERPELMASPWIKLAMKAYKAYDTGYYHTFFHILRTGPYLIRVCLSAHVTEVRVAAFKIMNGRCRDVTLDELTEMMCFETDGEMRDFMYAVKRGDFDRNAPGSYRPFDAKKDPLQAKRPALPIPLRSRLDSVVGAGMENCSVSSIVRGEAGVPDAFRVGAPLPVPPPPVGLGVGIGGGMMQHPQPSAMQMQQNHSNMQQQQASDPFCNMGYEELRIEWGIVFKKMLEDGDFARLGVALLKQEKQALNHELDSVLRLSRKMGSTHTSSIHTRAKRRLQHDPLQRLVSTYFTINT